MLTAPTDIGYGYDRRGRQTSITNDTTLACTLAFNDADELLSETYSSGPLSGLSVTNGFDTKLRRYAVALSSQPTTLVQFGYDTASRLAGVTNGYYNVTYNYLVNSPWVSTVTFRTNTSTRMTATKGYDYLNRLSTIASVPSSASAVSFSYAYNDANQRTRSSLAGGD